MTAARRDFTIERGADFQMDFDLPAGFDPTWASVAMQFRAAYGFPASLLTLTTINEKLQVLTVNSKLVVRAKIAAAVTAALYPGALVYDIKTKEMSGKKTRIWQGFASVSEQVTEFEFPGALRYRGGRYLLQRPGNGRILLRK